MVRPFVGLAMEALEQNGREAAVRKLVEQRLLVRASRVAAPVRALATGLPVLDRFLPHGGLLPGGLTEWVGEGAHFLAGWPIALQGMLGNVAYVGPGGCVDPVWVAALRGGELTLRGLSYLVAEQPDVRKLGWLAEQVIGSGLFRLVVLGGSLPFSGEAWFDEVLWRRWMGASKRHNTAVLVLLWPHDSLGHSARAVWGRLSVEYTSGSEEHPSVVAQGGSQAGALGLPGLDSVDGSCGVEKTNGSLALPTTKHLLAPSVRLPDGRFSGGGGLRVALEKCAGWAPGASRVFEEGDLVPVSGQGGVSGNTALHLHGHGAPQGQYRSASIPEHTGESTLASGRSARSVDADGGRRRSAPRFGLRVGPNEGAAS